MNNLRAKRARDCSTEIHSEPFKRLRQCWALRLAPWVSAGAFVIRGSQGKSTKDSKPGYQPALSTRGDSAGLLLKARRSAGPVGDVFSREGQQDKTGCKLPRVTSSFWRRCLLPKKINRQSRGAGKHASKLRGRIFWARPSEATALAGSSPPSPKSNWVFGLGGKGCKKSIRAWKRREKLDNRCC